MYFIDKMKDIADVLNVHDQKVKSAEKDWENAKANEENQYKANLDSIEKDRNLNIEAAKARKEEWDKVVSNSQKHMEHMQVLFKDRVFAASSGDKGNTGTAGSISFSEAISRLEEMDRKKAKHFEKSDNDDLIRIAKNAEPLIQRYNIDQQAVEKAAHNQYTEEMSYAQRNYTKKKAQEEIRHSKAINDAEASLEDMKETLRTNIINAFSTKLSPQSIQKEYDLQIEAIPTHSNYVPPTTFPNQVCFGYAAYEVTDDVKDTAKKQALMAGCNRLLYTEGRRTYLRFPYGYSFLDAKLSSLFEYDNSTRDSIIEHMQSLVLRLMMQIPCNKAWLTFIDPIELGKTFAMFAPWGEIEERVIDTRIWHDEARIEERLQTIIDHTSDVNFRCLQGRFKNIIEYNEMAGKNAEPLRFLIVMDFPRHFSPAALDKLESIITNGPSTGVFALIAGDVNAMKESTNPAVMRIKEKMNVFPLYKEYFFTSDKINNRNLRFFPISCVDGKEEIQTIQKIGEGIRQAEKIVIKEEDVYPKNMQLMSFDASNGINIPIGLEGANKPVELKLGGVSEGGRARSYHAMIGGSIGSGKSAMLHNIIMGVLQCYSPNEIQLYLVDMKEGVEFKRYAHHMNLANLRVVAIEAEKEFGLAVLQNLATEQWQRGQRFRETGTDRIETYNKLMREQNQIDKIMPRLVVVMDEVQGMFDISDDPITQECARLLESLILMGGSAFGIQMILATQDWNNVVGIKESIYNNIGVRIALKSTQESAQKLLSNENEAISRMATLDAGQAVFNEYSGHKDYNREFRGIFFKQDEIHEKLEKLEKLQAGDEYINMPKLRRMLSSDIQDHEENPLNQFANSNSIDTSSDMNYRLFVGESLGMINTFHPYLNAHAGKNLLLVGSSERTAAITMAFSCFSILMEHCRLEGSISHPIISVFDFTSAAQNMYGQQNTLQELVSALPEAFRVFRSSEVLDGLSIIEKEMEGNDDAPQHFVLFFGLNRARRLIEGGAYAEKPRDRLAKLFHIGPEKGMNFIVWANSPSSFQQFYNDSLGDFELRLVFDNTEDELYPYYIQDRKPINANDWNAISYNLDGDNQIIKMFTEPSSRWIDAFTNAIRSHIH